MCQNEDNCCVCEVVKVIHHIQKNRKKIEKKIDGCEKPFLGNLPVENLANTRPFILFTPGGKLWRAFFTIDNTVGRSPVFRVEKIDGCCATLRVLIPETCSGSTDDLFNDRVTFKPTKSFITINLECCCAIQCLKDTYIDCLN